MAGGSTRHVGGGGGARHVGVAGGGMTHTHHAGGGAGIFGGGGAKHVGVPGGGMTHTHHVGPTPVIKGPPVTHVVHPMRPPYAGRRYYGPPQRRPFMPFATGMEIGIMTNMMINSSRPRYYYPPPPKPTIVIVDNQPKVYLNTVSYQYAPG
jgi:hypothetical protein